MSNFKKKIRNLRDHVRHGFVKAQPVLEVTGEVARAALTASTRDFGSLLGVGLVTAQSIAKVASSYDVHVVYEPYLGRLMRKILAGETSYREQSAVVYLVDGTQIVVFETGETGAKSGTLEKVKEKLASLAAKKLPRFTALSWSPSGLRFDIAAVKGQRSSFASKLQDRVKIALEHTEQRTILLTGRPGVGKTTAAAWVCEQLAERVLVLDGSCAVNASTIVSGVCELLKPDALILDDVDRYEHFPSLQSFLDSEHRPRLVFLTSNHGYDDETADAPCLPPSLTRPPRVHESHEMLNSPVAHQRLPPLDRVPDAVWERIKDWGEADLREIALRVEMYGVSEDELCLDELEKRHNKRTVSTRRVPNRTTDRPLNED